MFIGSIKGLNKHSTAREGNYMGFSLQHLCPTKFRVRGIPSSPQKQVDQMCKAVRCSNMTKRRLQWCANAGCRLENYWDVEHFSIRDLDYGHEIEIANWTDWRISSVFRLVLWIHLYFESFSKITVRYGGHCSRDPISVDVSGLSLGASPMLDSSFCRVCLGNGSFDMGVSINGGTPKSSILMGSSLKNHPFWDTPILGNIHMVYGLTGNMMTNKWEFHGVSGTIEKKNAANIFCLTG